MIKSPRWKNARALVDDRLSAYGYNIKISPILIFLMSGSIFKLPLAIQLHDSYFFNFVMQIIVVCLEKLRKA